MKHRRTPSSTVALGTASLFIAIAIATGISSEPTTLAPATSRWELRGTVSPEGAVIWKKPSLA